MSDSRVKEILSYYKSENAGTRSSIARILNHGRLAGTGRVVILPVDQGFEHGPVRSFAPNPPAHNPSYHIELAIEAGCSAYAAPLGQIEAISGDYSGEIPLILKANNSETLGKSKDPIPSVTATVEDALRLGCSAVGFTIYPGSAEAKRMYEEARMLISEAKKAGLAAVLWSYPRGSAISKDGETAIDVVAYAAHIACQLGAHIVKVKPPTSFIEQEPAKKIISEKGVRIETLDERVRYVVQSAFNGKRIVIFSGGPAKSRDEILAEVKAIRKGGGFGSIVGRNAFQRPKKEAIELLTAIMDIYKG